MGVFDWLNLKRKREELAKKYQTEIAESERSALLSSKRLGKAAPYGSHLSPISDSLVGMGNYSSFF